MADARIRKLPFEPLRLNMGAMPEAVVVEKVNAPAFATIVLVAAALYWRVSFGAEELANRMSLESKNAWPLREREVDGVEVEIPRLE